MTGDGWALLRAIEADPADDVPRLAYADWLEENGRQPERAEFIRVQIQREKVGPDEQRAQELARREADLLGEHRKAWLAEARAQQFEPKFRRGFLNPLSLLVWSLVHDHEKLSAVAPLHHIRLYKLPRQVEILASLPVLRQVRRLSLVSNLIRNAHIATLAESPYLDNLVTLDLGSNHIGIAGCEALARANLPALRVLRLGMNPIRERGFAALLAAPWASRLEELDLHGCQLGPSTLEVLARSPMTASLRRLNLNYTQGITAEGTAAFAAAPLPALEVLDLTGQASDVVVQRLASNPTLGRLRELSLFASIISEGGTRAILDSPHLRGLRVLRLAIPAFNGNPALENEVHTRFGAGLNPNWQPRDEWGDDPAGG